MNERYVMHGDYGCDGREREDFKRQREGYPPRSGNAPWFTPIYHRRANQLLRSWRRGR